MALLLALEHVGLRSCPLDARFGTKIESAIKKLLNVPEHEVLIMFVAVGNPREETLTPQSRRYPVEHLFPESPAGAGVTDVR